ncbi:TPA: hypothetical protein O8U14_004584 [Enterobacter asburiae]|nr:hypothetical protein [Enterobacter asburiae]
MTKLKAIIFWILIVSNESIASMEQSDGMADLSNILQSPGSEEIDFNNISTSYAPQISTELKVKKKLTILNLSV